MLVSGEALTSFFSIVIWIQTLSQVVQTEAFHTVDGYFSKGANQGYNSWSTLTGNCLSHLGEVIYLRKTKEMTWYSKFLSSITID